MATQLTTTDKLVAQTSFWSNTSSGKGMTITTNLYARYAIEGTKARIYVRQTVQSTTAYSGTNNHYRMRSGNGAVDTGYTQYSPIPTAETTVASKSYLVTGSYEVNFSIYFDTYGGTYSGTTDVNVFVPSSVFIVAPATPTISASNITHNSVQISYGTTSFGQPSSGTITLYGGTTQNPTTVITSKTTTGTSTYTVTGLEPNTTYYFRTRAVNSSAQSSYVNATIKTKPAIYVSYNGVSKSAVKGYASLNGSAKPIIKAYDSVNGVSRRIF